MRIVSSIVFTMKINTDENEMKTIIMMYGQNTTGSPHYMHNVYESTVYTDNRSERE